MTTPADDQAPLDPLPPVPLMPPDAAPRDAEFGTHGEDGKSAPAPVQATCANCGTTLLGPHCYACGQPVKGMVRHLSSILADAADTILNIDSRIFRSILPLYFRPGYLTNEYFEGRRVRYVTPFRLYFFLSILAFFLMQFAIGDVNFGNAGNDGNDAIATAKTAQEVTQRRDEAIAGLKQAQSVTPDAGKRGIDKAIEKIQKKADKRLQYLNKAEEAKAKGESAPSDSSSEDLNFDIADKTWDPKANPVHLGGPKFLDDKITQLLEHAKDNLAKLGKDPKPLILGAIGSLPQVLFVLMPVFALLLKIFYVFKRRLYMEHMIVALHSHAFIFLSLFLLVLVGMAKTWAHDAAPWLVGILNLLLFVMGWWLPIYLFLMQKKVYKQGWIMTTLKYSMIGTCYTILISFCAAAAFLVSLATV